MPMGHNKSRAHDKKPKGKTVAHKGTMGTGSGYGGGKGTMGGGGGQARKGTMGGGGGGSHGY